MLDEYLAKLLKEIHERQKRSSEHQTEDGVRFRMIGDLSILAEETRRKIAEAETLTRHYQRMVLTLAFNYGGREDIVQAVRRCLEQQKQNLLAPEVLDENRFDDYLQTGNMPAPDLVIRTGGEERLSNFMLWPLAYSELVFLDCLWPDFGAEQMKEALDEYSRRERRFGRLAAAAVPV